MEDKNLGLILFHSFCWEGFGIKENSFMSEKNNNEGGVF